jgi:hypothetical protein
MSRFEAIAHTNRLIPSENSVTPRAAPKQTPSVTPKPGRAWKQRIYRYKNMKTSGKNSEDKTKSKENSSHRAVCQYTASDIRVLTLSKHTLCAINKRGRKINLEEGLPFIRLFVQADPI